MGIFYLNFKVHLKVIKLHVIIGLK